MPDRRNGRPHILAVDDDLGVLDSFHRVLDDQYDVVEAHDSDSALALVQSRAVDLVLLALLLPGLNGITLMERFRTAGVVAPIVVVSGIDAAAPAATVMRLGAFDYITKPFDDEALVSTVALALRGRAEAEEYKLRPRLPKILLIGCAVGTAAAFSAALSFYARVDTIPFCCDGLVQVPPLSADVVVVDIELVQQPHALLNKVSVHFPLSPIIVADAPTRTRSSLRDIDVRAYTLIPGPVSIRELFAAVTRELPPSARRLPIFNSHNIDAIEYVRTHFTSVGMSEVSLTLGKSPDYVSRLFCLETGMTLRAFINRVRVEAARQLLIETRDNIETVAALVGFHDASHLSRLFLKYLGRRPGDVRRTWYDDPVPRLSSPVR